MSSFSYLTFTNLKNLVPDMISKDVSKEHFYFSYSGYRFDCIFAFINTEYELLVGIHLLNFGFLININPSFIGSIESDDFFRLCSILHLKPGKESFTSNKLLTLLSRNIPLSSKGISIPYKEMRDYIKCKNVEESEKKYFKGWNDHIRDNKTAHNFDKTEFYLGKTIADYCRQNNISSVWTANPKEENLITSPWNEQTSPRNI